MSYAIIRFVTIGQALAKAFARTESKYPLQPRAIRKALHRGGRDLTRDHSQKAGGSGQGGHRLFGRSFRVAQGCCEGATHLAGKDDNRCDQCRRRVPEELASCVR